MTIVSGCWQRYPQPELAVEFDGDASLEVGGPFVGLAFHHSHMIPQRISFYYPVANSIDHSRDYWIRDTSHVMDWSLSIGGRPEIMLGREPSPFVYAPYAVTFMDTNAAYSLTADYRFCKDQPAMVQTIILRNITDEAQDFRFDYRLRTGIRTCHTYKVVNQAQTDISGNQQVMYACFHDPDTRGACIFIANAGEVPISAEGYQNSDIPYSRYIYEKRLKPGEELTVVLLIGSTGAEESSEVVEYLIDNYEQEVARYQESIDSKVLRTSKVETGDPQTNHSVAWAKAVMEANKHYLDGELVPMPCPAEYNFYFTHDVLVTDLAAVYFDITRVRDDLDYIMRHADDEHVIPHAYYWKDGRYVTEYASSDNWNNFWLILVTASYLRHSVDIDFVSQLYPYVSKSLERALLTREDDGLMWSYRPDWWDIGHNYGPRSYMTILAIQAIREYIYISLRLDKDLARLPELAAAADTMEIALTERLWNSDLNYLVNYHEDGSLDRHYYIGSLLAAHYNLLDGDRRAALVNSAATLMVDPQVGIYNAYPMDFEQWGEFMRFRGNEAGAKYYYFNGGIWPQGNAWYALALIAQDQLDDARIFINQVMSLHGILNGPNGQPAYYEVRNANRDNPSEYGRIDKPQFLWAGAWYLYSLYNLFGVRENGWDITIDPYLAPDQAQNKYTLFINNNSLLVSVSGKGETIRSMRIGTNDCYSAVLPSELEDVGTLEFKLGTPQYPYLAESEAMLHHCEYSKGALIAALSAFPGHRSENVVISPRIPDSVTLNGEPLAADWTAEQGSDYFTLRIPVVHTGEVDELRISWSLNE
ncbi:MAG: hypothetical protein JSU61_09240 [Fidelibacterota bacterium]|nr:MAG: hypothetical protein JSU61_09240 [Candidatus Neomarinimicrobiota bacterium]